MFAQKEIRQLRRSKYLVDSAVQELQDGQPRIVPRPFRMSAFLPMNTPILAGMILSPPTMFHTVLWQWVNQSYMAGLNYANKNPSSTFTNEELLRGYSASVSASIAVALALRKLTQGMTRNVKGTRLMILNTMVAALASSSAGYVNTTLMRQPEAENGVKVYSAKSMKEAECLGSSRICAKQAIQETALSRVALSIICCSLPTLLIVPIEKVPHIQRILIRSGPAGRHALNFGAIIFSLYVGLAGAASIFEPISKRDSSLCEDSLAREHSGPIYFSKGL